MVVLNAEQAAQLQALVDGLTSGSASPAERRRLAASIREHLAAKQEREAERLRKAQERRGYTLKLRLRVVDPRTGIPVVTAPATGRVWETDFFRCARFSGCLMEVRHCLERQGAKWPGGNRLGDGTVRAKKAGVHPYCSSGKCEQGADLFRRCDFRPELVWSKGRYRFYRPDVMVQRAAMAKAMAADDVNSERS